MCVPPRQRRLLWIAKTDERMVNGRKTAGYSFVLRDSDSFPIDHVGAVSLLLFSESSCYDAVMSRAKLLCSQYGLGIYEFKHNLVGKMLETAERLTKHVVTAPEKRLNVVYSPSAQIRAGHVAFLRSL